MSRPPYAHDDDGVVVVIGSGAGGATLAHELTRAGISVVLLEAGRMIEPAEFRNDELFAIGQQVWMDPRTTSGSWEVARLAPALPALTVKAVGGTTVHWGGLSFRLQPHEFKARTHYGAIDGAALADWPLAAGELDPWYDRAESRLGVTGTHGIPRLPVSNHFKVLWNGATRIGYRHVDNDRHAINSRPRDGRPACVQLGFCTSGCKSLAKWSASYTEIPAALATGRLELRTNAMVLRIEHGDDGRARSVVYADADGRHHAQRARLVCVAANAVETPRLLLNSASARFPHGLANDSGLVGRHFMRHINALLFGMFDRPVHMERGPVAGGVVYDESRLDTKRGFAGGYLMQAAHAGLPAFAAGVYPGAWGADFTRWIEAYPRLASVWANGEDLPIATNAVTLDPRVRDAHGLPVAHLHIDDHGNDTAMRAHFFAQARALLGAAGARDFLQCPSAFPAAHTMGSCRMSADPEAGVVDAFGRSHEVPNLFVSDGSQMVTAGAENPTLTIVALALRQADHIRGLLARRDHGL
jgi:choline dehydrogenase-like flavoprotein